MAPGAARGHTLGAEPPLAQVGHDLALAEAEKRKGEERRRTREELKKRQDALELARTNQTAYLTALETGRKAVLAKKYADGQQLQILETP